MKEDIKELEESLIGMGEDIIEIKKTLVRLDTLVSERNIQAEKFRDDINATLNKMTKFCIDRQLDKSKLWWGIIGAFLIPILFYAMAWGRVQNQVEINTGRLHRLENKYYGQP